MLIAFDYLIKIKRATGHVAGNTIASGAELWKPTHIITFSEILHL